MALSVVNCDPLRKFVNDFEFWFNDEYSIPQLNVHIRYQMLKLCFLRISIFSV